ncbi:hypothetical protein [Methylobacterium durans]|uniref:Uncharacterized protein n=1 Tax=Methylobacterium durans TaxID=2202825 RepID=A0A2U8W9N9_9HYPH|nr:hypothetical protein [Methylobacterium durans]AWN42321.1 hypothetical protein DK389_19760 [Methylobacterium durans]
MRSRFTCATLLLTAGTLLAGMAGPAGAQNPDQSFEYRQPRFKNACPPPLKFAAGACVRRCPAGYQNMGGYCRLSAGGW